MKEIIQFLWLDVIRMFPMKGSIQFCLYELKQPVRKANVSACMCENKLQGV